MKKLYYKIKLVINIKPVASLRGGERGGPPRVTPSRGVTSERKKFFVGEFTKANEVGQVKRCGVTSIKVIVVSEKNRPFFTQKIG